MLKRLAYSFLESIYEPNVFQKYVLGSPTPVPDWAQCVVQGLVGQSTVVSSSLSTPSGVIRVDDVIWLRDTTRLAKFKLAVGVGAGTPDRRFFVVAQCFKLSETGVWSAVLGDTVFVDVSFVVGVCCYLILGDKIFV